MRASHAAQENSSIERSIGGGLSLALATGVFLSLALFAYLPLLECAGSCFVDLDAVYASGVGRAGLGLQGGNGPDKATVSYWRFSFSEIFNCV